jgi:plastocyanin
MKSKNTLCVSACFLFLLSVAGTVSAQTVNGCNAATAEDHTADASAVVIKFGFVDGVLKYKPGCIKVLTTNSIQFSPAGGTSFAAHPLVGGTVAGGVATADGSSPIPNQGSGSFQAAFSISQTGLFGYYCGNHAISSNMFGAILVISDTLFADGFEAAN